MIVYTKPYIRSLTISDLPLLMAAQEASSHELDAMEPVQVAAGLSNGAFSGLVLEASDRRMLVTWQRDGRQALLTTLYREGTARGFLEDCHRLLERVEGILREFGVEQVYLGLGVRNPRFEKLSALYRRLGFGTDLVRMGKEL